MPTKKKKTLQKKSPFNKRIALISVAIIAAVGAYFLFFAKAAVNNCSTLYSKTVLEGRPVSGGTSNKGAETAQLCDFNQGSNGIDAVANSTDEVQNLARSGWTDWGVAFRAPKTPIDGAKPVHRFYNGALTAHFFAVEGSESYNKFKADAGNADEGIFFYAWDQPGQPNTEAVYAVNRKPLYFLTMYSTNKAWVDQWVNNTDGTWENAGIAFYAYNPNYFPPAPSSAATIDTNCSVANIKPGDKGACVSWHKGILNGYISFHGNTAEKLDTANNVFDSKTSDYTRLFVASLQSKGVQVPSYSNVLTREIWDALAKGYPPEPQAVAPSTPGRTNNPGGSVANTGGNAGISGGQPQNVNDPNFCPSLAYYRALTAEQRSKKSAGCVNLWSRVMAEAINNATMCPKQGETSRWLKMSAANRAQLSPVCREFWQKWEAGYRNLTNKVAKTAEAQILAAIIQTRAINATKQVLGKKVTAQSCGSTVVSFINRAQQLIGYSNLLGTAPPAIRATSAVQISAARTALSTVYNYLNGGNCSGAQSIASSAYNYIASAYNQLSAAYSSLKTTISVTKAVAKPIVKTTLSKLPCLISLGRFGC